MKFSNMSEAKDLKWKLFISFECLEENGLKKTEKKVPTYFVHGNSNNTQTDALKILFYIYTNWTLSVLP